MTKNRLVGKKGKAEVIEVYAATGNSERNEGRGVTIDRSYHPNPEQADVATRGIDVMGSKGTVIPRLAVKFADGTMLLVSDGKGHLSESGPVITFSQPTPKQITEARVELARKSGTAKLSEEERQALGLK